MKNIEIFAGYATAVCCGNDETEWVFPDYYGIVSPGKCPTCGNGRLFRDLTPGWFWQSCAPGCLPDSEPIGPFGTQQEAIDDANEGMEG